MIKFYYNGLKVNGGKLEKFMAWESPASKTRSAGIAIHARGYRRFSEEVRKEFIVENDTDSQTDYFEQDRFFVPITHPRYLEIRRDVIEAKVKKLAKQAAAKSDKLKNFFDKQEVASLDAQITSVAKDVAAKIWASKKEKEDDLKAKGAEVAAIYAKKYGLDKIPATVEVKTPIKVIPGYKFVKVEQVVRYEEEEPEREWTFADLYN